MLTVEKKTVRGLTTLSEGDAHVLPGTRNKHYLLRASKQDCSEYTSSDYFPPLCKLVNFHKPLSIHSYLPMNFYAWKVSVCV